MVSIEDFVFFLLATTKKTSVTLFFYTHVTRFSVGVCISRQSELLANDLSHSVMRLRFHCYLRALFLPGSVWRKSPRPKSVSHNFCLEWIELMGKPVVGWLVGKAISNNRSIFFATCTRCTWCYYRLLDTGSGYPCIKVCSGRGLLIVEIQAI